MYARRAYVERDVSTASPEQLLVLLYRGLARFVASAAKAMERGEWAEAGRANGKALDIVAHLSETIRSDVDPQFAEALRRMYGGWSSALLRGLAQRDVKLMREVLDQITGVCQAWEEAARSVAGTSATGGAPVGGQA